MTVHLVLGGARSGKTSYAEQAALDQASALDLPAAYVATGVATDAEMAARIERHVTLRSTRYHTVEQPRDLAAWLVQQGRQARGILLVDCLSTYLGTLLFDAGEEPQEASLRQVGVVLTQALCAYPDPVWVVSNEVGSGIVPLYPSARLFRDVLGFWNSHLAAQASDVTLLVAGLPLALKRSGQVCAQPI